MSPANRLPALDIATPDDGREPCEDCGGGPEHEEDCPVLSMWDRDPDDLMDLKQDRDDFYGERENWEER